MEALMLTLQLIAIRRERERERVPKYSETNLFLSNLERH